MSENASITPVQLAGRLQTAVRETGDRTYHCPPQMVYNYLSNNVRKLRDRATHVSNPSEKDPNRQSYRFTDEVATEFVNEMLTARAERAAKKLEQAQQEETESA